MSEPRDRAGDGNARTADPPDDHRGLPDNGNGGGRAPDADDRSLELSAMDTEESGLRGRYFLLPAWLQWPTRIVGLGLVLFHLVTAWTGALPNFIHRGIHVGVALVLVYLLFGTGKNRKPGWTDYLSILLVVAFTVNIVISYERIIELGAGGYPPKSDLILGGIMILVALETGRRTIGPFLPLLGILFLLYAYFGPYFPGMLAHRGFDLTAILEISYTTTRGMWGLVTAVVATVIAMFIIFGSTISSSGAGQALREISLWVGGRMVGGAAYVAVIASSLFGTVSGSTVSNVVATGSFTIPMMKGLGYNRSFAAAVEAVASTGGQIMPPVMGAAAFIMAEYLGIPYQDILLPALMPAILYYGGAFFAVRFYAQKNALAPVPQDKIGSLREVFHPMRIASLVLPLGMLVYFLMAGFDTTRAVLYAFLGAVVSHLAAGKMKDLKQRVVVLWHALEGAAVALAVITPLALCAQIVVMTVGTTGIGIKLSEAIISLSEGNQPIALILSALVAIVLGMGLPTPAAYVVAAAVLAPSLSGMGIPEFSAHLFMFYFAVMSSITPPVCAAVYVAANVADAPWMTVARYAMGIALPGLIVPFLFVANPVYLLDGPLPLVILATTTGFFGVACMASCTMGYLIAPASWWQRLMLGAAALLLLLAGWQTDLVGLAMAISVLAVQVAQRRRRLQPAAETSTGRTAR